MYNSADECQNPYAEAKMSDTKVNILFSITYVTHYKRHIYYGYRRQICGWLLWGKNVTKSQENSLEGGYEMFSNDYIFQNLQNWKL